MSGYEMPTSWADASDEFKARFAQRLLASSTEMAAVSRLLLAEVERLGALVQQTHGVHVDWVAEGVRLKAEVERLGRELDEQRDLAADCARADKEMGRGLIRQRDEAKAERDAAVSSDGECRKALAFWGVVLGFEPGRQVNQMVYWTMGDRRADVPPLIKNTNAYRRRPFDFAQAMRRAAAAFAAEDQGLLLSIAKLRDFLGWKP